MKKKKSCKRFRSQKQTGDSHIIINCNWIINYKTNIH